MLVYLSLAKIESSVKGFMEDRSNGQGNFTLVTLHLRCINQTMHKDVESGHMMLYAQSSIEIGDFIPVGVYELSFKTKNVTMLAGTRENMVAECVFSTLTNLESDLSCLVVMILEVALGKRPIEDDIILIINWDQDLMMTNQLLSHPSADSIA